MNCKYIFWLFPFLVIGCTDHLDICNKFYDIAYDDLNDAHEELFNTGKISDAILKVEELLDKDSNNFVAMNYLAVYKYNLCKDSGCTTSMLNEVYGLYKRSLELCDDNRIAYFNIIELLSEIQAIDYQYNYELLEHLEVYNRKYERRGNLMFRGGEALYRLGRKSDALPYFYEAVSLGSTDVATYIYLGQCYNYQKNNEKAIGYLNHALRLDSNSLAFHERGVANFRLGRIDEAIQDYQTAILLTDDRYESYSGLGQIEIHRNNIELACVYLNKAITIENNDELLNSIFYQYCGEVSM